MNRSLLLILAGLSGGCSVFNYDADNDPPPVPAARPTTVPSNEVADTASVGGTLQEIFIDFPTRVYDFATGKTPTAQAIQMEDAKTPDARRAGINSLVDRSFGKEAPYTTRYQQIAQFDADPLVRAAALRALNRSRDGQATGQFVAALSDASPQVRIEAAKALANVPSEQAVEPLIKMFNSASEDLDTRIAAADALRHYRRLDVARALVAALNEREFGLAWQARHSLRSITGHDERYDSAAWLRLLSGNENPLG